MPSSICYLMAPIEFDDILFSRLTSCYIIFNEPSFSRCNAHTHKKIVNLCSSLSIRCGNTTGPAQWKKCRRGDRLFGRKWKAKKTTHFCQNSWYRQNRFRLKHQTYSKSYHSKLIKQVKKIQGFAAIQFKCFKKWEIIFHYIYLIIKSW